MVEYQLTKFKHQATLASGAGFAVVGRFIDEERKNFFMEIVKKNKCPFEYPTFTWNMTAPLYQSNSFDHVSAQRTLPSGKDHVTTMMLFMNRIYDIKCIDAAFFFFFDYNDWAESQLVQDISNATKIESNELVYIWRECTANGKIFVYSRCDEKIYWFEMPTKPVNKPALKFLS